MEMMEKRTEKEKIAEGEREGGAGDEMLTPGEARGRERVIAVSEHRGHHSKAHKDDGVHKKSKVKCSSSSSIHKEHSSNSSRHKEQSSRRRRNGHSRSKHKSSEQAESVEVQAAAADRHAAEADSYNHSGTGSNSGKTSKVVREKSKPKKTTKTSIRAEKGTSKDRSKKERSSGSKKGSRKESETVEGKSRSTASLSRRKSAIRRSGSGSSSSAGGKDVRETRRSSKTSSSSSSSGRRSRSSSLYSSRCDSRGSSRSRSSTGNSRTTAPIATTALTGAEGKLSASDSPLPLAPHASKALLLGLKQKQLLPLPPLPKAAAAAAAALQEQCSKKKGQLDAAKGGQKTTAPPSAPLLMQAIEAVSAGAPTASEPGTAIKDCVTLAPAVKASEGEVPTRPVSTGVGLTGLLKVEHAAVVGKSATGMIADAGTEAKQKFPAQAQGKDKTGDPAPLVSALLEVATSESNKATTDTKMAEDVEEKQFPEAPVEETAPTIVDFKKNVRVQRASGGKVEMELLADTGIGAVMKSGVKSEMPASSRNTPLRHPAKTSSTKGCPKRGAAATIAPPHKGGKKEIESCKGVVPVMSTADAPCASRQVARIAAEVAVPNAYEVPDNAAGKSAGTAASPRVALLPAQQRKTGEKSETVVQRSRTEEGMHRVSATVSPRKNVQTRAAKVKIREGIAVTKTPTHAKQSTIDGPTGARAAKAGRTDVGDGLQKKIKQQEGPADEHRRKQLQTADVAAEEEKNGQEEGLAFTQVAAAKEAEMAGEAGRETEVAGAAQKAEETAPAEEETEHEEAALKAAKAEAVTQKELEREKSAETAVAKYAGRSREYTATAAADRKEDAGDAAAASVKVKASGEVGKSAATREDAGTCERTLTADFAGLSAAYADDDESQSETSQLETSEADEVCEGVEAEAAAKMGTTAEKEEDADEEGSASSEERSDTDESEDQRAATEEGEAELEREAIDFAPAVGSTIKSNESPGEPDLCGEKAEDVDQQTGKEEVLEALENTVCERLEGAEERNANDTVGVCDGEQRTAKATGTGAAQVLPSEKAKDGSRIQTAAPADDGSTKEAASDGAPKKEAAIRADLQSNLTGGKESEEEEASAEEEEEEPERVADKASEDEEDGEDKKSPTASLAASPSCYYSPSIGGESDVSAPDSQVCMPKDSGSAAEADELNEEEEESANNEEKTEASTAEKEGEMVFEGEDGRKATPTAAAGGVTPGGAGDIVAGDKEVAAEEELQMFTPRSGAGSGPGPFAEKVGGKTYAGLLAASSGDSGGGDTVGDQPGDVEQRAAPALERDVSEEAAAVPLPSPLEETGRTSVKMQNIVAAKETTTCCDELPMTQETTSTAPEEGEVVQANSQQVALAKISTPRECDETELASQIGRRRQRPAPQATWARKRFLEEGLQLWKMLLLCEEQAYDTVQLRVLAKFAGSRVEFVSVSGGCLGQPERSGDLAELLQQQHQLILQIHTVRSKIQLMVGKGGSSSGPGRRRPTKLQPMLILVERKLEEELSQVNHLVHLHKMQRLLQASGPQGRGGSGSATSSGRRPNSSERTAGVGETKRGGSSVGIHVGVDAAAPAAGKGLQTMLGSKNLLQLITPTPLCWYVHDVVGMVCRRRAGGPFPERWKEYREWCSEMVLEEVYTTWKGVLLKRSNTNTEPSQSHVRGKALVAQAEKMLHTKTGGNPGMGLAVNLAQKREVDEQSEATRKGEASVVEEAALQPQDTGESNSGAGAEDQQDGEGRGLSAITVGGARAQGTEQTAAVEVQQTPYEKKDQQRQIKFEKEGTEQQQRKQSNGIKVDSPKHSSCEKTVQKQGDDDHGAMVSAGALVLRSVGGAALSDKENAPEKEKGKAPLVNKRKRADDTDVPKSRLLPPDSSFICCNVEMVKHLVLLPCKAFLADRFFNAFPEKKALSFGTGNLKQRVAALRARRSWRAAALHTKQEHSKKEQYVRKQKEQQKQAEQQAHRHGANGGDAQTHKETTAASTTEATELQSSSEQNDETSPVKGGKNTELTYGCADKKAAEDEQPQKQHQQQTAGVPQGEKERAVLEAGRTGTDDEIPAKRRKKGGEADGIEGGGAATPTMAEEDKKEEKSAARLQAGTEDPAAGGKGKAASFQPEMMRTQEDGRRGAASGHEPEPEVVAVINLCMTERYYSQPDIRAQVTRLCHIIGTGVESYWLKVDGSGELPSESVVCVFFRLLAFITHKYAKLKKQQRIAAGSRDTAHASCSTESGSCSVADVTAAAGAAPRATAEEAEGGNKGSTTAANAAESRDRMVTGVTSEPCTQERHVKKPQLDAREYAAAVTTPILAGRNALIERSGDRDAGGTVASHKFTVLVHCTNGVNRTGLFTALLLMNLLGCDCNFALRAFAEARGAAVTKDLFKRWLRTEEAKGFTKAYAEALEPPALRGKVLAYTQRQQQQQLVRDEQQRCGDKEQETPHGGAMGQYESERGEQEEDIPKNQQKKENDSKPQQQNATSSEKQQEMARVVQEEELTDRKAARPAAAGKGAGKKQQRKNSQQRKKQADGQVESDEQLSREDKSQKQAQQEKGKQKQSQSKQNVLKLMKEKRQKQQKLTQQTQQQEAVVLQREGKKQQAKYTQENRKQGEAKISQEDLKQQQQQQNVTQEKQQLKEAVMLQEERKQEREEVKKQQKLQTQQQLQQNLTQQQRGQEKKSESVLLNEQSRKPNVLREALAGVDGTDDDDLTIATPISLLNALILERNFERGIEARSSSRLATIIAEKEKERRRLLEVARHLQGSAAAGRGGQEEKSARHSVYLTKEPTNAQRTGLPDAVLSCKAGETDEISESAELRKKGEQNPPQRQVAAAEAAAANSSDAVTHQEPGGTGEEGQQKALLEEKPGVSMIQNEKHQQRLTTVAVSACSEGGKMGSTETEPPVAVADGVAAVEPANLVAARNKLKVRDEGEQSEESQLSARGATTRPPEVEELTMENDRGAAAASAAEGGGGFQSEALQSMERAFQAEIEVVEELRKEAQKALQSIPQLPPRLPADGIVLVGPIQNALLAPEELLLQLLSGWSALKIESLDILVAAPAEHAVPGSAQAQAAGVRSAIVAFGAVKQNAHAGEEAKQDEEASRGTAAADTGKRKATEKTPESVSSSGECLQQQQRPLYASEWPQCTMVYPALLTPIGTRKRTRVQASERGQERERQQEGGKTGAIVEQNLLSGKRERDECGSRHSTEFNNTLEKEQLSGHLWNQKDSCGTNGGDQHSSFNSVKVVSLSGEMKEEAAKAERKTTEADARRSLQVKTGDQQAPTTHIPLERLSTSASAALGSAVGAEGLQQQQLHTLERSPTVQQPPLLHTLQQLSKVGTLEVIEEGAEEGSEDEELSSPADCPDADRPSPPSPGSPAAAGDNVQAATERSCAEGGPAAELTELGPPEKKQCVGANTQTQEEKKQKKTADASLADKSIEEDSEIQTNCLHRQQSSRFLLHRSVVCASAATSVKTADAVCTAAPRTNQLLQSDICQTVQIGKAGQGEEHTPQTGSYTATPKPAKASDFSLVDLKRQGEGLFSQRELALRLLEYREEDDLRLCYVARIQCADEASFVYLLSHRFQRMRQQPIQTYPSLCYPLLFARGKRLDRKILTHAKTVVLAANAAPAVVAAVRGAAAARKGGKEHDFLLLLGSATGVGRRGLNAASHNSEGGPGDGASFLNSWGFPLQRMSGAAQPYTLNVFPSPLPFMPYSMSSLLAARARQLGGLRRVAAEAGLGFYETAAKQPEAAVGPLAPLPLPTMPGPMARHLLKPFSPPEFPLFGAARGGKCNTGGLPYPPHSGSDVLNSSIMQDFGCCWSPFTEFEGMDAHEQALLSRAAACLYEEQRTFLQERVPPPPPGFIYGGESTPGLASQSRRLQTPGGAGGTRVVPGPFSQGVLRQTLPGSAVAAAALKLRRSAINRNNLAAQRRDVLLVNSRSREFPSGRAAVSSLPTFPRRSHAPAALQSAAVTAAGVTPRAAVIRGNVAFNSSTTQNSSRPLLTNRRITSRGDKGTDERLASRTPAFPRGVASADGVRQQGGFPARGSLPFPLPPPAPPLGAFLLEPPPFSRRGDLCKRDAKSLAIGGCAGGGRGTSKLQQTYMNVESGGVPPCTPGSSPFDVTGAAQQQLQQEGAPCSSTWMRDSFLGRSVFAGNANPQQGGIDSHCSMYTPLEAGECYRDHEGNVGGSHSFVTQEGVVCSEADFPKTSSDGQMPYAYESQTPAAPGGAQNFYADVSSELRGRQGGDHQSAAGRDRQQHRGLAQGGDVALMQRAPPPPPPLPEGSDVYRCEAGRRPGGKDRILWGETVQPMSPHHFTAVVSQWPSEKGGVNCTQQPDYQEQRQHHYRHQQEQQHAIGMAILTAGGRKSRVSGWARESSSAAGGTGEQQAFNFREAGQRSQSLAAGGVVVDSNAAVLVGEMLQQQHELQPNLVALKLKEPWIGGSGENERETAGVMWGKQEEGESAGINVGGGVTASGWIETYTEKAPVPGAPPQRENSLQQQHIARGKRAGARRMPGEGAAEWGKVGDSVVSDAAARAAAALMASQRQQQNTKGSGGGRATGWQPQETPWEGGGANTAARAFRRVGNSPAAASGGDNLYGRRGGDIVGKNNTADGSAATHNLLVEAGGGVSGMVAETAWSGGLSMRGQQQLQQGYFRQGRQQRVHHSAAGGSSTEVGMVGLGRTFPAGTSSGDREMSLHTEEIENSRGNTRSGGRVAGGPRMYGPPPPPAPPIGGGSSQTETAVTHAFGFAGGRQPRQGEAASDSSNVYSQDSYAPFTTRSGDTGGPGKLTAYGESGGGLRTSLATESRKEYVPYQADAGKTDTDVERLHEQAFGTGNADYCQKARGASGNGAWGQGPVGAKYASGSSAAPAAGCGGYGGGRSGDAEIGIAHPGGRTIGSSSSSGNSIPPFNGFPPAGRGSAASGLAGQPGMLRGEKKSTSSGPLGGSAVRESYGSISSAAAVPQGRSVGSAEAFGDVTITEGRGNESALRSTLAAATGLQAASEGTQHQFVPRGSGNQGRGCLAEQASQGKLDIAGGDSSRVTLTGGAGPGTQDARRLGYGNDRRFNSSQGKGRGTGGSAFMQRASGRPPSVPPGLPQWTIERLFQAAGAPRPPATGTGVEQQQPGSSGGWEITSRVADASGRGMTPCNTPGPAGGSALGGAGWMQQQQHQLPTKQQPSEWANAFGQMNPGSGLLWPSKSPPEGIVPATAAAGQQPSSVQQQQQQTAMMIQFAQQLALMQQQNQSFSGSGARGSSVDSLNAAANPLASLIGNFQQAGPGLTASTMTQQQLQQQLLMMCVMQQQQQQQQAGNNAPIPGMSAMDLQQLALYTQYYSMLLSGMSEQQATAAVQAQQLLQRQQDEIMKQQLLHQSIQHQQQLQLSLAGFNPSPAASRSALGEPCKGPSPTQN